MSQKFRIIFSGVTVALISIAAYFFIRTGIVEENCVRNLSAATESIAKYLREYDEKTGPGPLNTQEMRTILTDITEKFGSVAFVAVSDADFRIKEISRNPLRMKSEILFETIQKDYSGRRLAPVNDTTPLKRYYTYRDGDRNQREKFYFYVKDMTSYKLLIAYPYSADSRMLVRLALEMLLLVILAVIITTALYIISGRRPGRGNEEKAGAPPADVPPVKAAHARILRPSIVREESMERPLESSVAAHSLNSYIFDLLKKISAQYELDSLSLYLKNRQDTLSKTYELRGKRFLKIDSDTFETMNTDNELGRELKASSAVIMGGGGKVLVPLKRESSLLGLLILERGTVFSGSEISHIKSRLESISSDISDYLVINTVMINSATGLYSKAYYEVKYNELLRRHSADGTDFSVLFISCFEDPLSLSEEQRTSLFRIVAPTIKEYLNNSDTVCLYNDMIAILLPFTDSGKTAILADEIIGTLSRYRIKIDSGRMVTMKPACGHASTDSAPSPQGLTGLALLRLQRFRQPAADEAREAIAVEETLGESVPDVIPFETTAGGEPGEMSAFSETETPVEVHDSGNIHPPEELELKDEPVKPVEPAAEKFTAPRLKKKPERTRFEEAEKIKKKTGRPRITVGLKLISIISIIIIVSLLSMTFLTTYFFRNDNEIRIIENNQSISAIIGQKVMTDFMAVIDKATLAAPAMINENIGTDGDATLSQRLFSSDGDILAIYLCTEKNGALAPERAVFNSALMNEQGISAGDLSEVIGAESKQFLKSFSLEEVAHNMSPSFKIPVIGVSVPFNRTSDSNASSVIIALIRTEKFNKTVSNQGITKSFIVNSTGDLLAHYNQALVSARANFQQFPIVKIMMTSPIDNGQTRYRDENGTWFLGSYKKIGFAGAGVISTVEEQKAFAAVYVIQRRNFLITVIVLSVAILIVYFFAKTLTGPVKRLVSATNEIEQGNFDVDIVRSTNDEIGLLTESFINMGHGLSEREKIKDAFGKFVNKDIAEKVLRDEIKLGGERKEVTIFFSDIRSFTAISEKLEPEEVVDFLNEYMTLMVECINRTGGVVDKFIGDAIMATWGAPVSRENDTENAVNAAIMMRQALREFNQNRGGPGKPHIRIGCGINAGPALAGQIGSHDRMEYTVIGDSVNLASRIESLNKPFGTDILISEQTYVKVRETFHVEKMRDIKVKGKEETQRVYAVLGRFDDETRPRSLPELQELLGVDADSLPAFDPDSTEEKYEIISH